MSEETVTGTWFIVRTSLSFWRSRANPTVTYAPLPDGRVVDTVRYTRGEKVKLVVGVDAPQPDGSWLWRGTGPLTRLASSRWQVVRAGDDWAITHFEKTLFTPAGWDVYSRVPELSADAEEQVEQALVELSAPGLFGPSHDR